MSEKQTLTKEALLGFLGNHDSVDLSEYRDGLKNTAEECNDWLWTITNDEDEDYEHPGPPGFVHHNGFSSDMVHSFMLDDINRVAANYFDMKALSEGGEAEDDFVFSLDGSTYIVEPGEYMHETLGGVLRTLEEKHPAVRFAVSGYYLFAIRSESVKGQLNLLNELNRVTGFKKFDDGYIGEINKIGWALKLAFKNDVVVR